jgi:hypothetical protein
VAVLKVAELESVTWGMRCFFPVSREFSSFHYDDTPEFYAAAFTSPLLKPAESTN